MEAGKVLDAYGHAPGNTCQQADGKQAYTQTTLKGTDCLRIVGPKSGMASIRIQSLDCTSLFTDTPIAGGSGSNTAKRCLAK